MDIINSLSPLQWIGIGAAFGVVVALAVTAGNSIDPVERERDDEAQARDVTQPAPLTKHIKAGTAWGETL